MSKAAIVILADTGSPENVGRAVNALLTAREMEDSGQGALVIFDGAGTRWIPELADPDHRYHALFAGARDTILGACSYCARAFGALEGVQEAQIPLLDEYEGHPSLARLMADGYQVITF